MASDAEVEAGSKANFESETDTKAEMVEKINDAKEAATTAAPEVLNA